MYSMCLRFYVGQNGAYPGKVYSGEGLNLIQNQILTLQCGTYYTLYTSLLMTRCYTSDSTSRRAKLDHTNSTAFVPGVTTL